MTRYWFKFPLDPRQPPHLSPQYGVTAHNYEDAIELLQEFVFRAAAMPEPLEVITDVDVSALDPKHVLPNIAVPVVRGVWYPKGYGWMR